VHNYYVKAPMAALGFMHHDYADIAYSLPMPVIFLILAILVLVLFGMLSHVRNIIRGQGNFGDYMSIAVVLILLAIVTIVMVKAAFGVDLL